MLSTSVKQKASTEMGWLQWWNPQADQNGELFSQRIHEINVFYLALVPKTPWLRSTFTWEYENLDRAVLWGQVPFGAGEHCEFWRPLVVPCLKWHGWSDVHFSKLSTQGLGWIVFQQLPALRTVLVPALACSPPKKPADIMGDGVGLVCFWKAAWNCPPCFGVAGLWWRNVSSPNRIDLTWVSSARPKTEGSQTTSSSAASNVQNERSCAY